MNDLIPDEFNRKLLYSFLAYSMMNHVNYQKACLLHGEKNSGKTTLVKILKEIFKGVLSQAHLNALSERFGKSVIKNKLLNIGDDLTPEPIKDDGVFKGLVTNPLVDIDEKNKEIITVRNITKFMFICNILPPLPENIDEAYYRRWVIIETRKTVPEPERNPNYVNEILVDLEGIINTIMVHVKDSQELSKHDFINRNKDLFLTHGISSYRFVLEQCKPKSEILESDYSSSYEIYKRYKEFCDEKGFKIKSRKLFSIDLANIGYPANQTALGWHFEDLVLKDKLLNLDIGNNENFIDITNNDYYFAGIFDIDESLTEDEKDYIENQYVKQNKDEIKE